MGKQCTGSVQACTLRVGRLDDAGTPEIGADAMYVTNSLIKIDYKLVIKAGVKLELTSGCGDTCVTFQDDDKIESVDLSMELCILDAELIELLTGSTLITDGEEAIGWAVPPVGANLDHRVSVEAFTKAWDVDAQATDSGNALYHHFVWPSVSWTMGDSSLGNTAQSIPFTGHGRSNANLYDGIAHDLPLGVNWSVMGEYVDDNGLPLAACGFQNPGSS